VACGQDDAALFEGADAGACSTLGVLSPFPDFDENQGAVAVCHDQIDLAAAASGRAVIRLQQAQALRSQIITGQPLGGGASLMGRARLPAGLRSSHGSARALAISGTTHVNPSLTSALPAARDAAGQQHYPVGALYVVATPIGNLADISLRALHVLQIVDAVACEDTRHTASMLSAYGIERPLVALHEHNEAEAAQAMVRRMLDGQRIAYVSDAGTPAVSDPGARLVAAARAAGLRVLPLPGASSVTALLSVAGIALRGDFIFVGFLPSKSAERQQAVQGLAAEPRTQVLLEAPHRILALAEALAVLGARPVTVGRELTKQFEDIDTVPAEALVAWLQATPQRQRGEFVLALHPALPEAEDSEADSPGRRALALLMAELPLKTAVKLAAEITGEARNPLYEHGLALKKARDADGE